MAKGDSFVDLTIYKIKGDIFLMRDPKIVLNQLSSLKENQTVNGLYCNLLNPEFYKVAYQNIYFKPSQMTPANDGSTVDGMSMERIEKLIQKLKDKTYQPTPLRRIQIPKKNGGSRSISIPSFEDKLVQEVIRMILEALYEPHFSEHSHGFRPQKSCHTALKFTQNKFQGTKWWIDCDIKGCFDNINHIILLNALKEKIREQKFIHLINLFLKAGYVENWQYHKTYSGTPQGSIISPILANIYLSKFDKYMEKLINEFWKGERRKSSKEYMRLHSAVNNVKRSLKNKINIENNIIELKKRKRKLNKFVSLHGKYSDNDPNFRRLSYVRYADDFLVGVIASKKEAEEIKNQIQEFLREELKLELNEEKTKIVHNSEKIKFLGYELSVMRSESRKSVNGGIGLWLPHEVCKNFIIDNRFGKFVCDAQTGKPKLKATHRTEMTIINELEILMQYNSKIRGLYNYYKMASNVCKLNGFNYICQQSFLKTLSCKYKTSCVKLYKNKNYCQNKHIGITYNGKFYEFFNGPFNVVKNIKYEKNIDVIENTNKYFGRNSLIKRLEANKCEFCGNEEGPFEVHHIKKLKDFKGKELWKRIMLERRRKTIVLCITCHDKLHAGKL